MSIESILWMPAHKIRQTKTCQDCYRLRMRFWPNVKENIFTDANLRKLVTVCADNLMSHSSHTQWRIHWKSGSLSHWKRNLHSSKSLLTAAWKMNVCVFSFSNVLLQCKQVIAVCIVFVRETHTWYLNYEFVVLWYKSPYEHCVMSIVLSATGPVLILHGDPTTSTGQPRSLGQRGILMRWSHFSHSRLWGELMILPWRLRQSWKQLGWIKKVNKKSCNEIWTCHLHRRYKF